MIAHLLRSTDHHTTHATLRHNAAHRVRRLTQQRHGWGLLLVLCSLLIGCLIPIGLGILGGFSGLGGLIITLAGLAGVVLVIGVMIMLAAEGVILATEGLPSVTEKSYLGSAQQAAHTGVTQRFQPDDSLVSGVAHSDAAPHAAHH